MITCCQITCTIPWLSCEQLPYPPEHSRFSRIRQRDKSEIPLLTLSYKYLFPQHSFSILPSFIPPNSSLWRWYWRRAQEPQQNLPNNLSSLRSSLPREEMAVNFVVPEVNLFPSFSSFTATLYFLQVYLLSIFLLLSFSLFFQSSNFRNRARKLLFLPNNPIFNTSVHWVTQILPIW